MVDMSKTVIPNDIKSLCYFSFNILETALSKQKLTMKFPAEFENVSCPLFVTWKIGKNEDLRGCIGTFQSDSLKTNLPEYALISAFKDTRFSPITLKELQDLHVGISLLTDFEEAKDCYDWEVGKHGIKIFYEHYSATFLPEVAAEQGWNKETTLEYLLRKSGCKQKLKNISSDIKLTRYQSKKHSISFSEYKEYISKI